MSPDNTTPRRPAIIVALLNLLIGLAGVGGGLMLAGGGALSVHGEDMLAPLGLAFASGLLGVADTLQLFGWSGRTVAGLAGVVAVGGLGIAVWRLAARGTNDGTLFVVLVTAPVAVVAVAQAVYFKR